MSQAAAISASISPSVATTYTTDSGSAVPAANILNILGDDTTANDNDGIRTTGAGNTVTVQLTNRCQGTGSTVGAVTADLVTLSLGATPGTYTLEARVAGFNAATPASAGYSLFATVRTTGAAAVLVGTPDKIVNEEAALAACDATVVVSGNTAIIRVTGTAGLTVSWNTAALYTLST